MAGKQVNAEVSTVDTRLLVEIIRGYPGTENAAACIRAMVSSSLHGQCSND